MLTDYEASCDDEWDELQAEQRDGNGFFAELDRKLVKLLVPPLVVLFAARGDARLGCERKGGCGE